MKKLKVFAVAAALTLTTAGVFAGTSKFFSTPPNLYIEKSSGNYYQLASGDVNATNLQYGTSGTQVTVTGSNTYNLITYIATVGYENVVTTAF